MESGKEYKKGLWTVEEDKVLMEHVKVHGKGKWNRVPKMTGLKRRGKSCRLRWMNYLSPGVKRGDFSEEEEDLIIRLHNLLGNRWSLIAGRVPGRTDNQVKNYWNTHLSKKLGIKTVKRKTISDSQSHKTKRNDNLPSRSTTTRFDITNNNTTTTTSQNKSDSDNNKQKENTNNNIENLSWVYNDHVNLFSPLFLDPILEFSQDYML